MSVVIYRRSAELATQVENYVVAVFQGGRGGLQICHVKQRKKILINVHTFVRFLIWEINLGKKNLIVLVTKSFGLFEKLVIGNRGKIITILFSMLNYGQSSTSTQMEYLQEHTFFVQSIISLHKLRERKQTMWVLKYTYYERYPGILVHYNGWKRQFGITLQALVNFVYIMVIMGLSRDISAS